MTGFNLRKPDETASLELTWKACYFWKLSFFVFQYIFQFNCLIVMINITFIQIFTKMQI